jgi:hypothetical protein
MSTRIVAAVADAADCPTSAVQPLYTIVDPDTIDALFEYGQAPGWEGQLTFTLDGYRVTVTEQGDISVDGPDSDETDETDGEPGASSGGPSS